MAFSHLRTRAEFASFARACMDAESLYARSHEHYDMAAFAARKALELAVKWVYAHDTEMQMPERDNLMSLLHAPTFRDALDPAIWEKLPLIARLGNVAAHTERSIGKEAARLSLTALFDFIQWIDYCYGRAYEERVFSIDTGEEMDDAAEATPLRYAPSPACRRPGAPRRRATRLSEDAVRRYYIDMDLIEMGWRFEAKDGKPANVLREYVVDDMGGVPGHKGRIDYVLFGADGKPLALIEAKKQSVDPAVARTQAQLYADALERRYGLRPCIFLSNGFETEFWDDAAAAPRRVFSVFAEEDLTRRIARRGTYAPLTSIPIADAISDRPYQKAAIRAVTDEIEAGRRRHLLVMATGTGKTRTAASLVDVLTRANRVTYVLFLADRRALVRQAMEDFHAYLPDLPAVNLLDDKKNFRARLVISTYPTMMHLIDDADEEGMRAFSPGHFDLIIIDESHRSIFKKYGTIFSYFDARLVGLTATPRTDVARNTYDFFELPVGAPTYVYDYERAVEEGYLVPYMNYEVRTEFMEKGIRYDALSPEDRERYEADFTEDEVMPEEILPKQLNEFVFNEDTQRIVLEDLMERGIKADGTLAKTILFAANRKHAAVLLDVFNKLYPMYRGKFASVVTGEDRYAQAMIDAFKQKTEPRLIISVDMMDTGIDVPAVCNLVFFKRVRSKTKFWQMIGRGTRLCPELVCMDTADGQYEGKRRFLIFDYCGNFAFFRAHEERYTTGETRTTAERVFVHRARLVALLQGADYASDAYQTWRATLVEELRGEVMTLGRERASVRAKLATAERFKAEESYLALSEEALSELVSLAPLLLPGQEAESALYLDGLVYGMMLSLSGAEQNAGQFTRGRNVLMEIARELRNKVSIPQVRAQVDVLNEIVGEDFWTSIDLLALERIRTALRALVQYLDTKGARRIVVTNLRDLVVGESSDMPHPAGQDFSAYRAKVESYIRGRSDIPNTAIYKLRRNLPLTAADFRALERVFTEELGTQADYRGAYPDAPPFGVLVRRIAKLDRAAVQAAFSEFINTAGLNSAQIAFVEKVIDYVEKNGSLEPAALMEAPFDRPARVEQLFSDEQVGTLVAHVKRIQKNAVEAVS
jgi:hypothetical protein